MASKLTDYQTLNEKSEPGDGNESDNSESSSFHNSGCTKTQLIVVGCILFTEFCERLTYFSIIANMVLFCTTVLELTSHQAATVTLVFGGTAHILPVLGGYISDSWAGKFYTILMSVLVYIVGMILLLISAADYHFLFGVAEDNNMSVNTRRVLFYLGLALISIGTGGIKANVGPFGARQVQDLGSTAVQSFFNWFYWFLYAGTLIAFTGVAYIQQNISFTIGILIPLITMVIALITFIAAKKYYIIQKPEGSILKDTIGVCCATKCRSFDRARLENDGPYDSEMVDGVISVLRIIPIFLLIILYWTMQAQMGTTFFLQSERMNLHVGNIMIPAAGLHVFHAIIILILIPIMDRCVYPLLAKCNMHPSYLQRIGFGMVLVTGSILVAGVVEIYRKQDIAVSGGMVHTLHGHSFTASTISVFALTPEFLLMGSSEVFTSISGLAFAYTEAPEMMQGMVMGVFVMTTGLGNYLSVAILSIVKESTLHDPWLPDDINKGHAEYIFFLLSGLMMLNFCVFVIVAACYTYHNKRKTGYYEITPLQENSMKTKASFNSLDSCH